MDIIGAICYHGGFAPINKDSCASQFTVIFNSQNSIFSSMNFCFLITIFSIYNLHTT